MSKALYIGSDTTISLNHVVDSVTGDAVSDATITADVLDHNGDTVLGEEGLTFAYANGQYTATVPAQVTSTLVDGASYLLVVTMTKGGATSVLQSELQAFPGGLLG